MVTRQTNRSDLPAERRRGANKYNLCLAERIRHNVCGIIIEFRLSREFRKPAGEGPEAAFNRPYLNKTARLSESPETRDKACLWASEDLGKKMSHAKRRDLSVVRSSTFDGELVFDNASKLAGE